MIFVLQIMYLLLYFYIKPKLFFVETDNFNVYTFIVTCYIVPFYYKLVIRSMFVLKLFYCIVIYIPVFLIAFY